MSTRSSGCRSKTVSITKQKCPSEYSDGHFCLVMETVLERQPDERVDMILRCPLPSLRRDVEQNFEHRLAGSDVEGLDGLIECETI